jgi:hypothetical protein
LAASGTADYNTSVEIPLAVRWYSEYSEERFGLPDLKDLSNTEEEEMIRKLAMACGAYPS